MNICMVGAGYVGLVSAACFSEFGWAVMRGDVLVDLRNVFSAELAHANGLRYGAVGRKSDDADVAPTRVALRA